ncbi:cheY-homologous receiver domain [Fragilaria crotonensis]|nr:cheY-homologous receiver domain [Fragilaria crotonensis]
MRDWGSGRRSLTAGFLLLVNFSLGYSFTPLRSCPHHRYSWAATNVGYLPRSILFAASDAVEQDPEFEQIKDQQFRERNKRWLVLVDDEESMRMAVGDYLYDRGYKVTACADADALVEVVSMPPEEKKAASSKAFTVDRIEGYNSGADVYLTKPFDPDELLAIVDNLIVRRQQMTGSKGRLADLQEEMANIKQILKINGSNLVQKTDVYLTLGEREVLEVVCDGLSNIDIAKKRGVTSERVGGILQQLYFKTDTRSRTELVRWALKTGYVPKRM